MKLNIDIEQEVFFGSVAISIDVQKPIRHLILHAKDLNIESANVYTATNDKTLVSAENEGFVYKENQFFVIPMTSLIAPGSYLAVLSFAGNISTSLNGLYISRYVSSETNQVVKLATTQFEAGYARMVFPSFDEPSFKATFVLSVTHASNYSAISNMPVDYLETNQALTTTVFRETVRMSTYLVTLVVSDFVSKSVMSRLFNDSVLLILFGPFYFRAQPHQTFLSTLIILELTSTKWTTLWKLVRNC